MNGSNSIETNRMDYNPIWTYRYLLDLSEINSIHIGGISDVYISFDDVLWKKKELRSSDLCHTETNMKKNAHKYMRKICSLMHNTMLYYWLTGAMITVLGSVCSVFCFTTFISIIVQFTSTLSKKMIQCCRVCVCG